MDFKAILTSKALWGAVAVMVPTIAKATGHEIAPADLNGVVVASQQIINDAFVWGGSVLVVWGRFTAKGPLSAKPQA
jgi:hypothetical protein